MIETLPLFPLGTVLLPGASLPLHVFEPRYRQLTVDLVTGAVPGRSFGVVAIRQGHAEVAEPAPAMHEIGCSAVLREARRLPDGRFDVVSLGDRRFRLLEVDATSAPYLVGTVEWVPDEEPDQADLRLLPMLAGSAREAHRRYSSAAWADQEWEPPAPDQPVAALPNLLAADCLLTLEDRQALLEQRSVADRLRLVRALLVREAEFLRRWRAVPVPLSQFMVESSRN